MRRETFRFVLLAFLSVVAVSTVAPAGAAEERGASLPIRIGSATPESTVVVVPGDHLWSISETHLASILTHAPSDEEVSPYWREVIDENRHTLRSGDPDLIFPGEIVALPGPS